MATIPRKPWKVEYAKSGRSYCKTCKYSIPKEALRLGKMVLATRFDGYMPMWHHGQCILSKGRKIKAFEDVEGVESLRWEDQQNIRNHVDGIEPTSSNSPSAAVMECGIVVSPTSRATCQICSQKIMTGEIRISKPEGHYSRVVGWHHISCFLEHSPATQVEKLLGWHSLSGPDQVSVLALAKNAPPSGKDTKAEPEDDGKQPSKSRTKRKRSARDYKKLTRIKREDGSMASTSLENDNAYKFGSESSGLEMKLEDQARELWNLKDDIKKYVTVAEMRQMLKANDQDSTGSELDMRDRCADGMLFGALKKCPLCCGQLCYSGGMYRCSSFLSEWSKCSYSTVKPDCTKGKWKIPENTSNDHLLKWFKSQKAEKPSRILPPPLANVSGGKLEELKVAIVGLRDESLNKWKRKIESVGGLLHSEINKGTKCLVVSGPVDMRCAEIQKAWRMKLPIVGIDYLVECFSKQKKLPFDSYKIDRPMTGESFGMVTVKVKGRIAVHESCELQEFGHVLEDGNCVYNTTLNLSDLSTGVNSYYILQIVEKDNSPDCYVYRKWGRVGNELIGGDKLDKMSKSDAIQEYKRIFLEKTGNSWEAWLGKDHFQKRPGKFFPLEIDYGVNTDLSVKKKSIAATSKLDPPVVDLIKMLFDIETYRTAMMEFDINVEEMPLGKLSKSNIQKGFEALTEIQNVLSSNDINPAYKESLIVDASNRFFTIIPSIRPHVIRDEDDFKSKVKMLEALQDIEIASSLVGFDADDNDETLDEKYNNLHCDIAPISRDSEDYRLIEKYLHNTHAPTHTDWALELEEVYSLEREGEFDKFASYREKLGNRMLLWHGSRLTNFVSILSQGLRIAPREAPVSGYMFGKGIYFADLVSKSAQYCCTDRKNPVGLMLLSEVALGDIYELNEAKYLKELPMGKHSTKGLGKKKPRESEFVKWNDEVVVPCGKPVSSKVKATELMYNRVHCL